MEILKKLAQRAKRLRGCVIFAEGDEDRTLQAAIRFAKDGIGKAIVVAEKRISIEKVAKRCKLDLSAITILLPSNERIKKEALERFVTHKMNKGVSITEAKAQALEPLNFSALYVSSGGADSMVAGARANTADVLRATIYGIGVGNETRQLSSFFLMIPPAKHPVAKEPVLYADCSVNPDPTALGLSEIARSTVKSYKLLFPRHTARVAFLSFSTKGSAELPMILKIREASQGTNEVFFRDPLVLIDGELQFDAAVVPSVAKRKAPESPIAGNANILIFPDLNSGNIGYKMTERFGGFKAIGPILQGIKHPVSDLSRGCSIDDIYFAAAVTLLQSKKNIENN